MDVRNYCTLHLSIGSLHNLWVIVDWSHLLICWLIPIGRTYFLCWLIPIGRTYFLFVWFAIILVHRLDCRIRASSIVVVLWVVESWSYRDQCSDIGMSLDPGVSGVSWAGRWLDWSLDDILRVVCPVLDCCRSTGGCSCRRDCDLALVIKFYLIWRLNHRWPFPECSRPTTLRSATFPDRSSIKLSERVQ